MTAVAFHELEVLQESVALHGTRTNLRRAANIHGDDLALCLSGNAAKAILTTILEDKRDGLGQALAGFLLGAALPVSSWNLRAIRHDPLAILLEYSREFVAHLTSRSGDRFYVRR
jgi:hypothetical protein